MFTFQFLFTFQVLLSRPGNEKASTHDLENTLLYNLFDWEIAEFSHNVTLRLEAKFVERFSLCFVLVTNAIRCLVSSCRSRNKHR